MKINKAKLLFGKKKDGSNYIGVKVKTFAEPDTDYVWFFDKSAVQTFKEGTITTLTSNKNDAVKLEIAKKGDEKKLFLTFDKEKIELRLDKFGNYSYFNAGEIVADPFINEIANELKTSATPENTGEVEGQSDVNVNEPDDFPY